MKTRREKAEYLFCELGGINDALLHEAATYRPARQKSSRLLLIAACLCLSVCLVVGSVLILNRAKDFFSPSVSQPLPTVDSVLHEGVAHTTLSSTAALSYSDPAVVWQSTESDVLYIRYLNQTELERLQKNMRTGSDVGEQSPTPAYRIWIISDTGSVQTPYLKSSVGNTGVTLFDYDVERMPDQAFIDCLSDILNDQKGRSS